MGKSILALTAYLFLVPAIAEAHLVTTGLGPVYDGACHLFLTPEDLLLVVAVAIWAGLNGAAAGRWAVFALTGGWLAGITAGVLAGVGELREARGVGTLLAIGCLAASGRSMPWKMVAPIVLLAGLLHGYANGASLGAVSLENGQGAGLPVVGILGSVFMCVTVLTGFVVSLRADWHRLAARVAASWVAAIGVLFLGWAWR